MISEISIEISRISIMIRKIQVAISEDQVKSLRMQREIWCEINAIYQISHSTAALIGGSSRPAMALIVRPFGFALVAHVA